MNRGKKIHDCVMRLSQTTIMMNMENVKSLRANAMQLDIQGSLDQKIPILTRGKTNGNKREMKALHQLLIFTI